MATDPDFQKKILFSNEAHFWDTVTSKSSCLVCFRDKRIIGPHFFKNEADYNVTVSVERYGVMIQVFFLSELEDVVEDDIWFQQSLIIEENFWWAHYLASKACVVSSKIVRFNNVELFLVELREVGCLRV